MYKIGDYVVKSASGVCKVLDVATPTFVTDKQKKYYYLVPLADKNEKLYVPTDKVEGIRLVMTKAEAETLVKKIPEIHEAWIVNEKERERCYKEAVQSNDPEKLVGIIKLIYQRKQDRKQQGKKTTAVDERYFDIAENLLYSELELVMETTRECIYDKIKQSCTVGE